MADQVPHSGVACITDLIVKEGLINLDFADVRAVMREMGSAMMGTGEASGDRRKLRSAEAAIANPLIYDVSMRGARGVLISITGGKDLTLYEVDEAATRIREEVAVRPATPTHPPAPLQARIPVQPSAMSRRRVQIPARRDAEAIAEAVLRPTMKFIANSTCRRCTECVNGWSVSAPALEDYVHRNR